MASIRRRGDRWQARVIRFGFPDQVKSFGMRVDAERWARAIEREMDQGAFVSRQIADKTLLRDLMSRYAEEVSVGKRGGWTEQMRLKKMQRDPIAQMAMSNLRPSDIAAYRDRRLRTIKSSTCNRELQLIQALITHAMREWGVSLPANPVALVKKPAAGRGRCRVFENDEEQRLMAALDGDGYTRIPRVKHNPWIKPIVLLALETACRRGELLSMRWEHVDLDRQLVKLPMTKNGDVRITPLSSRAVAVLRALPQSQDGCVFPIVWTTLHQAFRKACLRAGLEDFHFHDLRHVATTRLAEHLPNVIELAAVTGHRSLSMLQRYYHTRPEVLAHKLG